MNILLYIKAKLNINLELKNYYNVIDTLLALGTIIITSFDKCNYISNLIFINNNKLRVLCEMPGVFH